MQNSVTNNHSAAEEAYDDEGRLIITNRRIVILALVSTCWFFVGHQPLLPLGFLYALWWVGSQADHTFLRGLRRGWRALAISSAAAAMGIVIGPSFGITKGGAFSATLHLGF